jgi:hypothetical protein
MLLQNVGISPNYKALQPRIPYFPILPPPTSLNSNFIIAFSQQFRRKISRYCLYVLCQNFILRGGEVCGRHQKFRNCNGRGTIKFIDLSRGKSDCRRGLDW